MNWILWTLVVVFAIFLIAAGITALRYRRQIQTGWIMFRTFRQMKKKVKPQPGNIPERTQTSDSPLVRCSKCQKWTPQDGAVKLKSNYFCSHSCMEQSFVRS